VASRRTQSLDCGPDMVMAIRRRRGGGALPFRLTAATAMLVGEFDARLRFIDGLPNQVHRSATMAAFFRGGFPQ
jgi:hypothetical protein